MIRGSVVTVPTVNDQHVPQDKIEVVFFADRGQLTGSDRALTEHLELHSFESCRKHSLSSVSVMEGLEFHCIAI